MAKQRSFSDRFPVEESYRSVLEFFSKWKLSGLV